MPRDTSKQAFAAREAHEALRDLKNIIDEATKTTHNAELESFHEAVYCGESSFVRSSLQKVVELLKSPTFDAVLSRVREIGERCFHRRPQPAGERAQVESEWSSWPLKLSMCCHEVL